jgi:hypothetical protein
MPKVDIGPLRLLIDGGDPVPDQGHQPGSGIVEGTSRNAVALGPGGIALDIRCFLYEGGGGIVDCPSIGTSPAAFESIRRGARMGIVQKPGGELAVTQFRALMFDGPPDGRRPRMVTEDDLDVFADGSARDLLIGLGASALGRKSELLGERGNDLVLMWPPEASPIVPFAAYSLTRVIPIIRALEAART